MAYKSVEIDDNLMLDELAYLRNMKWSLLDKVRDKYDFGFVDLDCTAYKERVHDHCQELIDTLESYIRHEFVHKKKQIELEIIVVKGKLEMDVKSIDDVIMLLDYIEQLKMHDTKIADIVLMINELAERMDYVEHARVFLTDEQY